MSTTEIEIVRKIVEGIKQARPTGTQKTGKPSTEHIRRQVRALKPDKKGFKTL